jgi:Immunity protein 42
MIAGNINEFALDSEISRAYSRLSLRALGFFQIYINGIAFGVRSSDATMLALSFDSVEARLRGRGTFLLARAEKLSAETLARAVVDIVYTIGSSEFLDKNELYASHILWPSCDEAFDDGSQVLHFDEGDTVRVIGFRQVGAYVIRDLVELRMQSEAFYAVLQDWHDAFLNEWARSEKLDR